MAPSDIPVESIAILDSSILIAMGSPSNAKYQAFERYVTRRNIDVLIPGLVAQELGEAPDAYAFQRDRLQAAQDAGWLERATVDFSNPAVSDTIDRTRMRMATLSADDVSDDEIEKTDTVLAGLVYQVASETSSHVSVLVSDQVAAQAIGDVLSAVGVADGTSVIEGGAFLERLVDTDFD